MRNLVNHTNEDGSSAWLNPVVDHLLSDAFPIGCGDRRVVPDAKPSTTQLHDGKRWITVPCFVSKYGGECASHDGVSDGGHGYALNKNLSLPLLVGTLAELARGMQCLLVTRFQF